MNSFVFFALPALCFAFPPRMGDPFSPLGSWSRRGPPCGLPRWVDKLPEDAQERVRAIWANHKEGEDCNQERMETKNVIRALSEEVREKIFAGRCGPSFLRGVAASIRRQFRAVWFDHKLSVEEKETALKKLAFSTLTGESLARFNKWSEELVVRKEEIAKKVAALSPAAKEAYENWKAIRQQEKTFLSSLSKEVRDELKSLCGCGFNKKENKATTSTPSSTTSAPETTTELIASSTTEKTTENEFAIFLDAIVPEDLTEEAQCAYDD